MPAVRGAIVSRDRGAVVSRMTTMNALLATSIAQERYRALLSSVFGFSALLLSAIAIYGIVARGTLAPVLRAGRVDPAVALRQG
jgi:hypothetical protein